MRKHDSVIHSRWLSIGLLFAVLETLLWRCQGGFAKNPRDFTIVIHFALL